MRLPIFGRLYTYCGRHDSVDCDRNMIASVIHDARYHGWRTLRHNFLMRIAAPSWLRESSHYA